MDGSSEFFGDDARLGTEGVEEEGVVPYLGRVVECGSGGGEDDFFKRHVLLGSVYDKAVEVVDVGLKMLAVMVFQCFLAHQRLECVQLIGERG